MASCDLSTCTTLIRRVQSPRPRQRRLGRVVWRHSSCCVARKVPGSIPRAAISAQPRLAYKASSRKSTAARLSFGDLLRQAFFCSRSAVECTTTECTTVECATVQCTTAECTTTVHYTTVHYSTVHYSTVHYTTVHYSTVHYKCSKNYKSRARPPDALQNTTQTPFTRLPFPLARDHLVTRAKHCRLHP